MTGEGQFELQSLLKEIVHLRQSQVLKEQGDLIKKYTPN